MVPASSRRVENRDRRKIPAGSTTVLTWFQRVRACRRQDGSLPLRAGAGEALRGRGRRVPQLWQQLHAGLASQPGG